MILGTLRKDRKRLTLNHDGTWDVRPVDPVLKRILETLFNPNTYEGTADGELGQKTLQDVNLYLGGGYRIIKPRRRKRKLDKVAY